jgi:uncharacterized CHY-type Zn-finger protein
MPASVPIVNRPSPNVIRCPKCHAELDEADALFTPLEGPLYAVTCGHCQHQWTAHHAHFYPRGTAGPSLRNPFTPLRIPTS